MPKTKPTKKPRPVQVEIRRERTQLIGKVTTRRGYVYACSWAPDTELTEDEVRKVWTEDRRAFRPYNESTGVFL